MKTPEVVPLVPPLTMMLPVAPTAAGAQVIGIEGDIVVDRSVVHLDRVIPAAERDRVQELRFVGGCTGILVKKCARSGEDDIVRGRERAGHIVQIQSPREDCHISGEAVGPGQHPGSRSVLEKAGDTRPIICQHGAKRIAGGAGSGQGERDRHVRRGKSD